MFIFYLKTDIKNLLFVFLGQMSKENQSNLNNKF